MYSEWIGNLAGIGATMAPSRRSTRNRYPQQSFIIRGEPVRSARPDAGDFATPATWKWSRNAALIWARY